MLFAFFIKENIEYLKNKLKHETYYVFYREFLNVH